MAPARFRKKPITAIPFVLIPLVCLTCAKSIYPPGGPVDREAPTLVGSFPATGSVNSSGDVEISIEFSEPLNSQTVDKAVFISPNPAGERKIRVRGEKICIRFSQPLELAKTYVVTLGTDIKDAHGVNLARAVSVAFATGPSIDTGSISGRVTKEGRGASGVSLALFDASLDSSTVAIDSLVPDYMTQSGKEGEYSFDYLPAGTFRLVAFEDKNKNRRINPQREMTGVPFMEVALDEAEPRLSGVDIRMHSSDSGVPGLRGAAVNADGLIRIRFSAPVTRETAGMLMAGIEIQPIEVSAASPALTEYTNVNSYPGAEYLAAVAGLIREQTYLLKLDRKPILPDIVDSLRYSEAKFTYAPGADVARPQLLESSPADKAENVALGPGIYLRFSEAVESTPMASAIRLAKSDGESTLVAFTPRGLFRWEESPATPLSYSSSYWLLLDGTKIRDRAGNPLADSTVVISFRTLGKDTLGELSGTVEWTTSRPGEYPIIVSASPVRGGLAREIEVPAGQSSFVMGLLPGYYTLFAYLDRNRNRVYDFGSLRPYRPAEPFCQPADTIRIRSRFESAGATVKF